MRVLVCDVRNTPKLFQQTRLLSFDCGRVAFTFQCRCRKFRSKAIPEEVKEKTDPEPHRVRLTSPKVFDAEAFKRTIINNNLFRPLGWTPPRSIEPYRLIGTILPRAANTPLQAIIQTAAGNTTHIVTTGEKIDADTEVVSIESKQVVLESKGQPRTLYLPSGF